MFYVAATRATQRFVIGTSGMRQITQSLEMTTSIKRRKTYVGR